MKQTLATVKRELVMVKRELVTVKRDRATLKRELKSTNHKLSAINQPRRAAPVTDRSASQAGQQTQQCGVKTLADVPLNPISDDEEARIYNDNVGKCDKYALQIFKSLVNPGILSQWAGHVNYKGKKGRKGVPRNVINAVNARLGRRFPGIGKMEEQAINNQINGFLRRPSTAFQR
ncbi:Protein Pat [Acipenser ruthenus]|uniref:Protein Pat n=1 Tax=Acipenser ruthenus TaxID=7906 RepID=A0A444URY5_ACIRT|nr:Protein Pat [Acipenser ruthenus]